MFGYKEVSEICLEITDLEAVVCGIIPGHLLKLISWHALPGISHSATPLYTITQSSLNVTSYFTLLCFVHSVPDAYYNVCLWHIPFQSLKLSYSVGLFQPNTLQEPLYLNLPLHNPVFYCLYLFPNFIQFFEDGNYVFFTFQSLVPIVMSNT